VGSIRPLCRAAASPARFPLCALFIVVAEENPVMRPLLCVPLCCVVPLPVLAATQSLPALVVTANRIPEAVSASLAAVTVIDRQTIEQRQQLSLPELLRGLAGVDVFSNGGLGQNAAVSIRGSNAGHVLLLIDGVKLGSATLGTAAFQHLPLSEIERIEVVRGPRSALYGSEAVGGVVQIFTRTGDGPARLSLDLGGGSNATYRGSASLSGGDAVTRYSVSGGWLGSDGYNTCDGALDGGCYTDEPDRDGYDNTAFSGRVSRVFSKGLTLEAHALRSQGNNQYDSSYQNEADFVQQSNGLNARYQATSNWLSRLETGESVDELSSFGHGLNASAFNTRHRQVLWQNDLLLTNQQQVTIGYEYSEDRVSGSTAYTQDQRDNQAYFTQLRRPLGGFELMLAVREDDNSQFGSHRTGQTTLGFALSPRTQGFLSYGTAFKAPAFNDLYYPDYGNPELKPEQAKTWELGFSGEDGRGTWNLNLYRSRIDQLISGEFDVASGSYRALNLNQATIRGAELAMAWRTRSGLEFASQVTWLQPEDEQGHTLPRRAQRSFSLTVAERLGNSRLALEYLAQGHRYEDRANDLRLGGYGLLNLHGEYRLGPHWQIRARLDNLLDKAYQTAHHYDMPGRQFWLSLSYQSR